MCLLSTAMPAFAPSVTLRTAAPAKISFVPSSSFIARRTPVVPQKSQRCRQMPVLACAESVSPTANADTPATAAAAPAVADIYKPFWDYATKVMQERMGSDMRPYPIPEGFEHKSAMTGKGKRAALVTTDLYAYQTPKLRHIRAAHVKGGAALQVLNFVIFPDLKYDVPFFGADLVTLPGGHLIAIDMQPLFHTDAYKAKYSNPIKGIFEKHQANLPWGGDFPPEAARFFSPCFIWSRPTADGALETHVFEAFKDYLHAYMDILDNAKPVEKAEERAAILESQIAYVEYRAEKDPARGMLTRFYGEEWCEEFIHKALFVEL
jgi:phycoerythrobilin:ferredoxin oxidoreductase